MTGVWSNLGDGYCFSQISTEKEHRITGWTDGSISDAKANCEANAACVGFHHDASVPDFVLLSKVGTPGGQNDRPRKCYEYIRPTAKPAGCSGSMADEFLQTPLTGHAGVPKTEAAAHWAEFLAH